MPPDIALRAAPRVVRPISWRWTSDREKVEILDEREGRFTPYHPWVGDVLDGLAAERPLAEHAARLFDARRGGLTRPQAEHMVRKFLFSLRQSGHVDLGLPPAPKDFAEGRYEVLAELGRGGIGVAWRCRDARSGGEVVVKEPWGFFTDTKNADAHLRREAAALAAFDHPGIAARLGTFEQDGFLRLVRGYVDGRPLHRHVPASHAEFVDVASRVAEIVEHVHECGFLLLDIQPGNFLLASGGAPVLIDVGLAARVDAGGAVRMARASGTRGFVPPEVRASRIADARSDVWVYGRLLFALATGTLPREAWDAAELRARMGTHAAAPLVARLTASEPEARPPSMREARAALTSPSTAGG